MDFDLIDRHAGHAGGHPARSATRHVARRRLKLSRGPDGHPIRTNVGRAVHWFHRRMGQIRNLEDRLDQGGRGHRPNLTDRIRYPPTRGDQGVQFLRDRRIAQRRVGSLTPDYSEGIAPSLSRPEGRRDNRDPACHRKDLLHPGHGQGFVRIEGGQFSAERRASSHHGHQGVSGPRVEPIHGPTGDLFQQVEALNGLANEPKIARPLEGHLSRHRQPGRGLSQSPERSAPAGGGVDDLTRLGATRLGAHLPVRRRRRDQHSSGGGPRLAEWQPPGPDRGTAAGCLNFHDRVVVGLVSAGKLIPHHRPIGVEFLGHEHRKRGADALPHLRSIDDDSDDPVPSDSNPRIGSKGPGRRRGRFGAPVDHHRQGEAGTDTGRDPNEVPPVHGHYLRTITE